MNVKHRLKTYLLILLAFVAFPAPLSMALTASQIINKTASTVESFPSLHLSLVSTSGKTSVSAKLVMSGPRFVFTTSDMEVYYDGQTQWTFDPSAGEVTLTTPTAEELAEINPLAFLRNYARNSDRDYTTSIVSTAGNKTQIKMVAKTRKQFVKSTLITIDTSTWLPTEVKAELTNGQTVSVRVVSSIKGKALQAPHFRFPQSKYPTVEVIDLR